MPNAFVLRVIGLCLICTLCLGAVPVLALGASQDCPNPEGSILSEGQTWTRPQCAHDMNETKIQCVETGLFTGVAFDDMQICRFVYRNSDHEWAEHLEMGEVMDLGWGLKRLAVKIGKVKFIKVTNY